MDLSAGFLNLPGGSEWLIILLAVVLIFGPKNLPRLGSAMGRFVTNLKSAQRGEDDDEEEDEDEVLDEKPSKRRSKSKAEG